MRRNLAFCKENDNNSYMRQICRLSRSHTCICHQSIMKNKQEQGVTSQKTYCNCCPSLTSSTFISDWYRCWTERETTPSYSYHLPLCSKWKLAQVYWRQVGNLFCLIFTKSPPFGKWSTNLREWRKNRWKSNKCCLTYLMHVNILLSQLWISYFCITIHPDNFSTRNLR